MSDAIESKAPIWFMVSTGVLFVWNILGVMAYISYVTITPDALALMSEAERQLHESTPAWVTAAFAIAVNGGAFGCLLLLFKRNLAGLFLRLSLAAVAVQMFHAFFMSKSYEVYGPGGMVMPLMVIVIAILLVRLAAIAKARHWTN